MSHLSLVWTATLLACALPVPVSSAPRPTVAIAGQLEDGTPSLGAPVDARRGQQITLHAVIRVGARTYADLPQLLVGGRRLRPPSLRPLSELTDLRLAWYQVEPEPHHVSAPPNPGNPAYSNAVLFGKRHGRWLGYDSLEYHETLLAKATRASLELRR